MHAHRPAALATALLLTPLACSNGVPTGPVVFSHMLPGPTVLDQSQPFADTTAPFTIAIGGEPEGQVIAQVFTAGVSGRLREVELPVACASGTLELQIRDAPGGTPGSVVLASELFSAGSLPAAFPPGGGVIWSVLRLRPSPDLTAGVQYTMVLSNPDSPPESCGMIPGPVGDSYSGGDGYFFDTVTGAWIEIALGNGREDLPFFTYILP